MRYFYTSILILFAIVFCSNIANSQYFIWGNEPMMKWKVRQTKKSSIISPTTFKYDSIYTSYIDSATIYHSKLLNTNIKKANIILHPNTLISNGFVSWAPSRSELFTAPARNLYSGFWPQQLAWHELRHYAQFSLCQKELKKGLGALFGQYLSAAWIGITTPMWFIEGDATLSETSFLNTGRGRSANFSTPFFAWIEQRKTNLPDYDRCVLGSYNNYTPNRYLYGYWMLAKGQERYGNKFWVKTFEKSIRFALFGPFTLAFKSETKQKTPIRLYNRMMLQNLSINIDSDIKSSKIENYNSITNSENFTEYRTLGKDEFNNLIVYKKDAHSEPCFIAIRPNGKEKRIRQTGILYEENFGFDGKYIYYAEYKPHERWGFVDYATIKRIDIKRKKIEKILEKGKYIIPTLSSNNKFLIACANKNDGNFLISSFNIPDKTRKDLIEFNYDNLPISMAFDDNNNCLYLIQQTVSDRRIVRIDSNKKGLDILFYSSDRNINNLILNNNYLYFNANLFGNEEIYRLSTNGGEVECLTNTKFGAAYPFVYNDELFFSETTSNGEQLRTKKGIEPINPNNRWKFMYNLANKNAESTSELCSDIEVECSVSDANAFKKGKHIINVHSVGPITIDPSTSIINPGVQFDSQDLLSTTVASVFSGYNINFQRLESGARFSYHGLYPILSLQFTNYLQLGLFNNYETYNNFVFSAKLPLIYNKNTWIFKFSPEVEISPWSMINQKTADMYYARHYGARFLFSTNKFTNSLNIFNKLGFFLGGDVKWQEYKFKSGTSFSAIAGFWLPGMFRHDGFRFRVGYEMRDILAHPFITLMNAPRGYNLLENPVMSYASGEYASPLIYPDVHLGSLMYLKRISGMVSYDYGVAPNNSKFSSIGYHLIFDMNFFRIISPISIEFSTYKLIPANIFAYQIGFGIDLNTF